jgi:hypothetical protein
LDERASKCEEVDNEKAFDFPAFEWLDVFAAAAYVLSVCEDIDSSGNLPHECRKESAQYLAWKFGNLVGKLAVSRSRWQDDPFKHFWEFSDAVNDQSFTFGRGHEQTAHAIHPSFLTTNSLAGALLLKT